jgi:hypothetical protein
MIWFVERLVFYLDVIKITADCAFFPIAAVFLFLFPFLEKDLIIIASLGAFNALVSLLYMFFNSLLKEIEEIKGERIRI